jgi:salicylate hydroxylase
MLLNYPISQGKVINIVLINMDMLLEDTLHPEPWVSDVDASEITSKFPGWAAEARQTLDVGYANTTYLLASHLIAGS